jgi:ketosteroid isomerase-like protein
MLKRIALLVILSAAALGQSSLPRNADVPSPALMSKILEAWDSGGPAQAAPFYDKKPPDVFFDVRPLQYRGWDAYKSGAEQDLSGFEYLKFHLNSDAQVHRAGNIAWGTATCSGEGKLKSGNKLGLEGRWTVIWAKQDGKWLIVHEHLSVPWTPESESRHR